MSVKQMALVWEYEFDHAEQSVMLALADHAHDDGTEIRPSVARLAWKTGYETRQVQRILKHLRDNIGILVLTKEGGGRGNPNVYHLDWRKGVKKSPFKPKGKGDKHTEKGDISSIKGDITMSPEPSSSNHPLESSDSPRGDSITAKDFVAYVTDIVSSKTVPIDDTYKMRLGRDIKLQLEKGTEEAVIWEWIDRIVDRWDDWQLSLRQAATDMANGRNGNGSSGKQQTNGTSQEVINYVLTNNSNEAITHNSENIRLAMARHDFTSGEHPPYNIQKLIGGTDDEAWRVLSSIKSLINRYRRSHEQ